MYMILTFLLITSLASSLSFVLLLAVQRIFEYSYTWLYNLMKVIVVFYLFPAVCFILVLVLRNIEDILTVSVNPDFINIINYIDSPISKTFYNSQIIVILFYIWCTGAVISMVVTFVRGEIFIKRIKKISKICEDKNIVKITDDIKQELQIRRKIAVYLCPIIISPFTCGIFCSIVVLPDMDYTSIESRLILKHELVHLKNNDVFYKQAAGIVTVIHWFNPITYIFVHRMYEYCELACDSIVIDNQEKSVKILYARLIVKMLERSSTKNKYITISSLEDDEEKIKKRLERIMKKRTFTRYQKVALALTSAIILAICPVVSYASTAGVLSAQKQTTKELLEIQNMENDAQVIEITDSSCNFTIPAGATVMASVRGDNSIDVNINSGSTAWLNTVKLGDGYIKVSLTADSSNDTFTVGYTRKGGAGKKAVSKDGGLNHSFSITADTYNIYIQNTSDHAIHVSGRITV